VGGEADRVSLCIAMIVAMLASWGDSTICMFTCRVQLYHSCAHSVSINLLLTTPLLSACRSVTSCASAVTSLSQPRTLLLYLLLLLAAPRTCFHYGSVQSMCGGLLLITCRKDCCDILSEQRVMQLNNTRARVTISPDVCGNHYTVVAIAHSSCSSLGSVTVTGRGSGSGEGGA
jgi:hypothetical protein